MSYLNKLESHEKKKIKIIGNSVRMYFEHSNSACALKIHDHNDQNPSTGIELKLVPLVERLQLSALAIRPRIHINNRNNGKYADGRCNGVLLT